MSLLQDDWATAFILQLLFLLPIWYPSAGQDVESYYMIDQCRSCSSMWHFSFTEICKQSKSPVLLQSRIVFIFWIVADALAGILVKGFFFHWNFIQYELLSYFVFCRRLARHACWGIFLSLKSYAIWILYCCRRLARHACWGEQGQIEAELKAECEISILMMLLMWTLMRMILTWMKKFAFTGTPQ